MQRASAPGPGGGAARLPVGTEPYAAYSDAGRFWARLRAFLSMGKTEDGEYKPSLWLTVKAFDKDGDESLPAKLATLAKGETVRVRGGELPLAPVRSAKALPKELLLKVAARLREIVLEAPVAEHQVVCANVLGTGVDIIATPGTPVMAAAGGVVSTVQFHPEYGPGSIEEIFSEVEATYPGFKDRSFDEMELPTDLDQNETIFLNFLAQ